MIPITIFLKTIQWIFSRIFRLIFLFCSLEKLGSFNLWSYLGQGCQICTKWDKSGTFIDQVLVHFDSTNQNVLKCDFKKFRICSISCQSVPVQGSCQASGIYKATVKTNIKPSPISGVPTTSTNGTAHTKTNCITRKIRPPLLCPLSYAMGTGFEPNQHPILNGR